jgi:hypothetical protein
VDIVVRSSKTSAGPALHLTRQQKSFKQIREHTLALESPSTEPYRWPAGARKSRSGPQPEFCLAFALVFAYRLCFVSLADIFQANGWPVHVTECRVASQSGTN